MDDQKNVKNKGDDFHYNEEINLRSILQNAIKMQALYSGKKIRIVETSKLSN